MKSIPKLIRRFVGIGILSAALILLLNIVLLGVYTFRQLPNARPWKTAEEVADKLQKTEGESYVLPDDIADELEDSGVWAVFIDNNTGQVIWRTENLPGSVPMSYTFSDIAGLTRGYIDGYPTFTGEGENGLAVLGYPKDSFWKHMWPSWDYGLIEDLPKMFFSMLGANVALIFVIYVAVNSRLLKSVKPIVSAIQALPSKEPERLKETGLMSELAVSINKTSDTLRSQSRQLRRKETARANWIAGVSHDIRTPLSMVMGYASQLEEDAALPFAARDKAAIIVKQSRRMKNLVNDLNLASKLEYDMQPIRLKEENMIALARQTAVDFMNMDHEGRYPIEWETDEEFTNCPVNVDRDLIKRALGNLIQNCINHNEQGCRIYIRVAKENGECKVTVSDDGVGADDEQIEKINHAPHYMVCDGRTTEQRHGLGLLIVKQIAAVHQGTAMAGRSEQGGFLVEIRLPVILVSGH